MAVELLSRVSLNVLSISNAPICVACSGGSDSVALLRLLCEHNSFRERLHVLHFDHGVRTTTSERDRIFVKKLSEHLGVPFHCKCLRNATKFNEDILRNLRMKFFHDVLQKLSTPFLLTAHQCNDVLEMFLMRLARGSSLEGLTAPQEIHNFRDGAIHLKPLLNVSKSELINYLRTIDQEWREDETNNEAIHVRNRVRLELLPLWKTFEHARNFEASLLLTRALLIDDLVALNWIVDKIFTKAYDKNCLLIDMIDDIPNAILRRVLYRFFNENGIGIGHRNIEMLQHAIARRSKFKLTITASIDCICDDTKLFLKKI
jgi:tRNA(Ile)-lysidine synthetase-like protein